MKKEDRDLKLFILVLVIVLSLICIRRAFLNKQEFGHILLFCALILFAIGILRPKIFAPIYRFWMILAKAISALITATLLVLVFYLVVTPIGLVLRLSGKDLLELKMDDSDSYWHKKEGIENKANYLKQF